MSQENVEAVRGLLAHWATRFALLLSLLAFGALGAVSCDDDETATAETETEVTTSDFGQDPPGRVVVAGGPKACGDYRKGPGAIRVRIEVFQGVVRCREARRVLKNLYPQPISTPPWSCVGYGVELVQCTRPGGAFRGIIGCRVARPTEVRAACPGFELPMPGAELYPVPARKSCGHFRIAPPGDHPLILVEVVIGRVPCRAARRVLKTQFRNGSQDDAMRAALPWRCARAEGLIVCDTYSGQDAAGATDHKAIRARFRE
jgi:hypothetical protein